MIDKFVRAFANGAMQLFEGQTYDEWKRTQSNAFAVNQLIRQLELEYAKYGITYSHPNQLINAINSGDRRLQTIAQNDVNIQRIINQINQY